jgi:chromate transporter
MTRLQEVIGLMLRLGLTAFGGPAAHIAMLRQEVVVKRAWITEQQFLDYLGIVNLIPGPNSTELVMHVSMQRAGWRGLWLGGTAFILPAASLTLVFAWLYQQYGTTPIGTNLLNGIKPVVIAVVAQALHGLLRPALKTSSLMLVAAWAAFGYLIGMNELVLMLALVLGHFLLTRAKPILVIEPLSFSLIFLLFLKIGATLYGSGYVLLAYLKNEFVTRGWLTEPQLLAAIAIGQLTPGPVFSSATFVGFQMAGLGGALLATIGIFLPAFIFVWLTHRLLEKLRALPWTSRLLDAVNAAALGLMLGVLIVLTRDAIISIPTGLIAVFSLIGLVRFKINSTWLIVFGALLGMVFGLG